MGTYTIPRNLKGETRLLYIFSIKSLITTAIGIGFGAIFYFIFAILIGEQIIGLIFIAVFRSNWVCNRYYKNTNIRRNTNN